MVECLGLTKKEDDEKEKARSKAGEADRPNVINEKESVASAEEEIRVTWKELQWARAEADPVRLELQDATKDLDAFTDSVCFPNGSGVFTEYESTLSWLKSPKVVYVITSP